MHFMTSSLFPLVSDSSVFLLISNFFHTPPPMPRRYPAIHCVGTCCAAFLLFIATIALILVISVGNRSKLMPTGLHQVPDADTARNLLTKHWGGLRPVPGNSTDRLMWFAHISDIHIMAEDPNPSKHLRAFVDTVLPILNPAVVIATGDLCNSVSFAKYPPQGPILSEWQEYRTILSDRGVWNTSFWLDLRGNHDALSVGHRDSNVNYFPAYGAQGSVFVYKGLVMRTISTAFGKYAFVLVDTNVDPSLAAPWTLDGAVPEDVKNDLKKLVDSGAFVGVNGTIFGGHHPLGSITGATPLLDTMTNVNCAAYLCGHYHEFGLVSRHPKQFLEMLARDHKTRKFVRVFAFDHDMLSYADLVNTTWPLILITNPKRASTLLSHEPYPLIRLSTHIRCLIFSPTPFSAPVLTITDSNNNVLLSGTMKAQPPLYTMPWSPDSLPGGLLNISVSLAVDGVRHVESHIFSVDGTGDTLKIPMADGMAVISIDLVMWIVFVYSVLYVVVWKILIPISAIHYIKHTRDMDEWISWVLSGCNGKTIMHWLCRCILDGSHWFAGTHGPNQGTLVPLGNDMTGPQGGGKTHVLRAVLLVIAGLVFLVIPVQVGPMVDKQWGAVFAFYGVFGGPPVFVTSVTWGFLGFILFVLVNPLVLILVHDHRMCIDGKHVNKTWNLVYSSLLHIYLLIGITFLFPALAMTAASPLTILTSPSLWFALVSGSAVGHMHWKRHTMRTRRSLDLQ